MKQSALFIAVASALALDAAPALAQEHTAQLEQVIVTSRRVEESVQNVPLAVSALSAEALESKGVVRMNDLVQQTPSVTSQPTSGRSSVVNFGIRGQRNTDVLPTADPSVIVYIADVPQMRGYGLGALGSLDVQTVEVLKGPQGTLFGRSTTGGAISITPAAPTGDLSANITLGAGEYNRQMARAIVNVPITDTVAARIAVQKEKRDGVYDNKGSVGHDAYGDRDELSWRGSLQFQPTDALTSTFYTDGFQTDENGPMVDISNINNPYLNGLNTAFGGALTPLIAGLNAAVARDGDPFSGTTNIPKGFSKITVLGVSNTTSYDISDSMTIKNIAGYRYIDVDDYWDLDGTSVPMLSTHNVATTHQYSEELQLSGQAFDDRADWITGVFWMKEYSPDYSYTSSFGDPRTSTTGTYARNVSKSAFGQGAWHFTDALNLTIGARANHDDRLINTEIRNAAGNCTVQLNAAGLVAPNSDCHREESKSFSEPSYSVTLDYHFDADKMIYVAHRHGYRSGGFNGRANLDVQFKPFKPETVDDLEVGFKGDLELAGRPLRVNAAAFYSDYQEVQKTVAVQAGGAGSLSTNVVNAASATIDGGELEVTWLPLDSVQLDIFYAYVHAKYDEWLDPNAANPAARDKTGSDFAVPLHSGGATLKYTLPVPTELGAMSLQGNVYAQAEAQLADENGPGGLQSGYNLLGARADWQDVMGSKLKLSLWGKNLNNTKYYVGGVNVNNLLGYYMAYPGQPRSWGVDATYDF